MDKTTRGRATRTKREQQERILAEWDQSGLSGVDFARSRGLKVDALYRWRKLQRNPMAAQERPAKVDFFELTVGAEASRVAPEPMTVHLGDSIRVEVSDRAQLDWVAALSQKLEALGC